MECEGEDIEVLEMPIESAWAMVQDGRIMDGKTIILLQYLQRIVPPPTPMIILVAGPYRTDTRDEPSKLAANLQAMQENAAALMEAGHIPMVAEWLVLPLVQMAGSRKVGDEVYQRHFHEYSKALLLRCDAVLRIGGRSEGADVMVSTALQHGLLVFRHLEEVPVRPIAAPSFTF